MRDHTVGPDARRPDARTEKPDKQGLALIGWSLASLALAAACIAALLIASEPRWALVQHSALATNVETH
jgi:hypothetical protein